MPTILVATASGLRAFDGAGGEQLASFEERSVGALASAGGTRLWAVVDEREIWRSDDGDWQHIASLEEGLEAKSLAHTRANAEGGILVGTSEARLMRVTDDLQLEVVDAFDQAPGRDDWFTPWGGPPDTRSMTGDGDAVYVNVHVGGILRSRDAGESWQPTIDIYADIHRVVIGNGRVYAAGARGLSTSADGGDTWSLSAEGLHAAYCRGVAVCGDALLVSASTGPGNGRAALYRSDPAGERFERCRAGLPEWFEGNIDSLCIDALRDGNLAAFATETGELYASTDQGASWSQLATGLPTVTALLTLSQPAGRP